MRTSQLLPFLLVAWCGIATAQEPAKEPMKPVETPVVQLTLYPQAEPQPALRYRLWPTMRERKPGNAAIFFYRGLSILLHDGNAKERLQQFNDHRDRWEKEATDPKVREEMRKWVADLPSIGLGNLRECVYREEIDFSFRLQDVPGPESIAFTLGELQEARTVSGFLSVKCRVETLDGKFDDALDTLRMLFSLARITAAEPILINRLVGAAIAAKATAELEQLVARPGAPNLYWAVASLPRPLVDMRPAIEFEMGLPEQVFPLLKNTESTVHSKEEWQRLVSEAMKSLLDLSSMMGSSEKPTLDLDGLAVLLTAAQAYPLARKDLLDGGYKEEQLKNMSTSQVVAIHVSRVTKRHTDEMGKAAYVAPREGEAIIREAERKLIEERGKDPLGTAVASALLPAVGRTFIVQWRVERDLAALQTLEALRAHLAATGKFPQQLSEIKALPVPKNPFTEETFPYRLEGEKAILEIPPPPATTVNPQQGKRYEITVGK